MYIPLFTAGFSMVMVLMFLAFTSESMAVVCLIFTAVSLAVILSFKLFREDKTLILSLASALLALLIFIAKTELDYKPVSELCGKEQSISGTVLKKSGPGKSGYLNYTVRVDDIKADSISGRATRSFKMSLYTKKDVAQEYDRISFTCDLTSVEDNENKYRLMSKGIYASAFVYGDIKVTGPTDMGRILRIPSRIAHAAKDTLYTYLKKDYASLLVGMLLGDKEDIPDETYESFKAAGVVHILSVSGFHTSLWCIPFYKSLVKNRFGRKAGVFLSLIFVAVFVLITGVSLSAVRAGIMVGVFLLGRLLGEESDSLNSLGFAALIMVVLNPFVCGDIGFLLSFFSTLGILVLYPLLRKKVHTFTKKRVHNFNIRRRVNAGADSVLISVSALVFTFPIVMLTIGNVSPVSAVSNLIIPPFASYAVFLSGLGILSDKLTHLKVLSYPVFFVCGMLSKLITETAVLLSSQPFSYVDVTNPFVGITTAALLIFLGCSVLLKTEKTKLNAALMILILISGIASRLLL